MRKAQLTIEYLIILVIMLILFNSISMDLINTSQKDSGTLQTVEMVSSAKMILSDSYKTISLQGSGAKKTVTLRAPPDCDYIQQSLSAISMDCVPGSASAIAGYDGAVITPGSVAPGISFTITDGTIGSGKLGKVTISKA
jgi:hypothetical protein